MNKFEALLRSNLDLTKTQLRLDKLNKIFNILQQIDFHGMDGNIAELGILMGGLVRMMAAAFPNKTVYAFDTFCGLPDATEEDGRTYQTQKEIPNRRLFQHPERIYKEIEEYISLPNVILKKGLFPDTFDIKDKFCFVHLDSDLYEGTKYGLELFGEQLVYNGIIVVDDYNSKHTPGVTKAVNDFLAFNKNWDIGNSVAAQCVLVKRER